MDVLDQVKEDESTTLRAVPLSGTKQRESAFYRFPGCKWRTSTLTVLVMLASSVLCMDIKFASDLLKEL